MNSLLVLGAIPRTTAIIKDNAKIHWKRSRLLIVRLSLLELAIQFTLSIRSKAPADWCRKISHETYVFVTLADPFSPTVYLLCCYLTTKSNDFHFAVRQQKSPIRPTPSQQDIYVLVTCMDFVHNNRRINVPIICGCESRFVGNVTNSIKDTEYCNWPNRFTFIISRT